MECIVRGLEVGTLVFMQYKVVGDEFVELPIRTVDTGYGIDRFTWISQGVPSFSKQSTAILLDKVMAMAGITNIDNDFLARVAKYSGLVSVDKRANRMVARKRVSELTGIDLATLEKVLGPNRECLGSNRPHQNPELHALRRRRAIQHPRRLPRKVTLPQSLPLNAHTKHEPAKLYDIVEMQANYWAKDFPHIKAMQGEIIEMLKVEEEKFKDTLQRGEGMVKRIAADLKSKGTGKLSWTHSQNSMIPTACHQKSLSKPQKKKASKLKFLKTFMP